MRHTSDKDRRVTIPAHNKDIRAKTMHAIIKESGLSLAEFIELL